MNMSYASLIMIAVLDRCREKGMRRERGSQEWEVCLMMSFVIASIRADANLHLRIEIGNLFEI